MRKKLFDFEGCNIERKMKKKCQEHVINEEEITDPEAPFHCFSFIRIFISTNLILCE